MRRDDDWHSLFEDRYLPGDIIIPPSSIMNGTAPAKVFMEYLQSVDMEKVRLCDVIAIMHWLNLYIENLTPEQRKQMEETQKKQEQES